MSFALVCISHLQTAGNETQIFDRIGDGHSTISEGYEKQVGPEAVTVSSTILLVGAENDS